jgi:hypothetical protein
MAANIALKPPGRFNFKQPDDWPKWKRRFLQYLSATGLEGETDARKISTLLYCLGEEAEDVLTSTSITDAERAVYDTVVAKLDGFFKIRRNTIFDHMWLTHQQEHSLGIGAISTWCPKLRYRKRQWKHYDYTSSQHRHANL